MVVRDRDDGNILEGIQKTGMEYGPRLPKPFRLHSTTSSASEAGEW